MIYIPIFVNIVLLLLFDYRCLSFSLCLPFGGVHIACPGTVMPGRVKRIGGFRPPIVTKSPDALHRDKLCVLPKRLSRVKKLLRVVINVLKSVKSAGAAFLME